MELEERLVDRGEPDGVMPAAQPVEDVGGREVMRFALAADHFEDDGVVLGQPV